MVTLGSQVLQCLNIMDRELVTVAERCKCSGNCSNEVATLLSSLVPRLLGGGGVREEKREPGTDCLCMRLIYQHSGITVFLQDTFCLSSVSDIIRQTILP